MLIDKSEPITVEDFLRFWKSSTKGTLKMSAS